jgi:hypothetical protein
VRPRGIGHPSIRRARWLKMGAAAVDCRATMRLPVSRYLLLACALLAVVPAAASAAAPPKVSSVAPLQLKVGDTLTIRGKGFIAGRNRNTVIFKATGTRAVFAKAQTATTTRLVVKVPAKLVPFLTVRNGAAVATRFQIRVLAKRLSAAYTPAGESPVIAATTVTPAPATGTKTGSSADTAVGAAPAAATPAAPAPPAAGPVLSAYEQCMVKANAAPNGDEDADGMPNGVELTYHVDPCNPDTDGDGLLDGYEYDSARDLNSHDAGVSGNPYPGDRPWPNPLDASDTNDDFDGDGLTLKEEYALWWHTGHQFPVTKYSDGSQASGGTVLAGVNNPLDLNGDGALTDDERDADNDGLSNVVELHLRGIQSWWRDVMTAEPRYTLRHFADLDPTVRDSDGAGVPDGADDQDVDGYSNFTEMQLRRAADAAHPTAHETVLVVDPYNPCMPNPHAATCGRYIPVGAIAWRPFRAGDAAIFPLGTPVPFTTDSNVLPPNWSGDTWDGLPGLPNS